MAQPAATSPNTTRSRYLGIPNRTFIVECWNWGIARDGHRVRSFPAVYELK